MDDEDLLEGMNQRWILEMNGLEMIAVKAVLECFKDEHGHEPEAQSFLLTFRTLNFKRVG